MAIVPEFKANDFAQMLLQKKALVHKAIIRRLTYLGELCVNHARTNGSYTDRTGNLRNSVGFIVVENGQVKQKNFNSSSDLKSIAGGDTIDGKKVGLSLALELAKDFDSGFVLIVVAGMHYATYVEAKGKDVLSSAQKLAEVQLPNMLAQLKANINKAV